MKLFYSSNSPYARRPRLAIRETGLLGKQVEEVTLTTPEERVDVLIKHGPGTKVPALLTDNNVLICESLIIARVLDELSGGKLYPKAQKERELAYQVEGVASLLMDSLFHRSHEKRRDPSEQSPSEIEKEAERAQRCYDELARLLPVYDGKIDMASMTVVASLGYADGRHPDDNWREGRGKLADWFETIMQRPAMAETKPNF
jgi:glutathione S-transferase